MGMFDEVFIVGKVKCISCRERIPPGRKWQTKGLGSGMGLYKIAGGRMYKSVGVLPEYLSVWTEEEAKEHNDKLRKDNPEGSFGHGLIAFWSKEAGDKRYLEGSDKMEAQEWKSMGELPHQHLRVYTPCKNCPNGFAELAMKFTDGVLVSCKEEFYDWEAECTVVDARDYE